MNRLSQQRGASLLEVLSVIVLLSIVGAVAYSFLMNTFLFEDRVTERQSLVQEVNLLSADLRRLHESGAPIYYDGSMLYEGRGADRPILNEDIRIESFYANENELAPGTSITLTQDTYRFEGTITAGGYNHELRTASRRTGAFVYDPGAGNEDVEPEPPPEEPLPPEALEDITFPSRPDINSMPLFSSEAYGDVQSGAAITPWELDDVAEDNVVHDGRLILYRNASAFRTNNDQPLSFNIDHSLLREGNLTIGSDIFINTGYYVWVDGNLTMEDGSAINAENGARIQGDATMQGGSELAASQLQLTGTAALQSDSVLTIAGPSTIDGPLTMDRDSIFTTGSLRLGGAGTFRSNAVLASENEVTIGGEATFQENVNVQAGSLFIDGNMRVTGTPVIQIDGDAGINGGLTTENTMYMTVGGDLVLENGAALRQDPVVTIGGTLTSRDDFSYQSGSTIIVEGNADIRGNIGSNSPYDQGSMCVQGSLSLEGEAYPGVDITNSGSDCSNLSPGELRVLGPIL
ncbi:PulJ/GspJ family protein [Alkalicoccus urumqiensis]|nr:hypothetical protein [Alkalicoccus urumqiensis]